MEAKKMRLTDELDRLVLGAVGDEFVPLEFIVDKLGRPGSPIIGRLDPDLIYSRLLNLIADKLINAYLLHAEPPYITPVQISPRALPTSWFYITQRGRKCLASGARGRVALRDKDARPEDEYPPAVNF